MSKGGRENYLYMTRPHLRPVEVEGLTPAQQLLRVHLHDAIYLKGGFRVGYLSYDDMADLSGLHRSTCVDAIKVLVAKDLMLKRNRVDTRSKALSEGGKPYLASNLYMILPPLSERTTEQQAEIDRTRLEWGQAELYECRNWRRVRQKHVDAHAKADGGVAASLAQACVKEVPTTAPPDISPVGLARQMVVDFHEAIGSVSPVGRRELELAEKMISMYGDENTREVARFVIKTGQPRTFMLMDYYWHRFEVSPQARPTGDDAADGLAAQIRKMLPGLSARVSALDFGAADIDEGVGMIRLRLASDIEVGHDALAGRVSLDIGFRTLESVADELDRMDELRRIRS